jgi:hypothetical protein
MTYFELAPAYGRDYKSKAEVVAAWNEGKDFAGDFQLGFKPVNKADLEAEWKGKATVHLRYKGCRQVAVVKV